MEQLDWWIEHSINKGFGPGSRVIQPPFRSPIYRNVESLLFPYLRLRYSCIYIYRHFYSVLTKRTNPLDKVNIHNEIVVTCCWFYQQPLVSFTPQSTRVPTLRAYHPKVFHDLVMWLDEEARRGRFKKEHAGLCCVSIGCVSTAGCALVVQAASCYYYHNTFGFRR